ncbi:MAG: hypothetical protein AB1797_04880 [bacterium]
MPFWLFFLSLLLLSVDSPLKIEVMALDQAEGKKGFVSLDSKVVEAARSDPALDENLIAELLKKQEAKIKAGKESGLILEKQSLIEIKEEGRQEETKKDLPVIESKSKEKRVTQKEKAQADSRSRGKRVPPKKKALPPLIKEVNIREIEEKSPKKTEPGGEKFVFSEEGEIADFLRGKKRDSELSLYQMGMWGNEPDNLEPVGGLETSQVEPAAQPQDSNNWRQFFSGANWLNSRNTILFLSGVSLILLSGYLISKRKKSMARRVPERERIKALYGQMQANLELRAAQNIGSLDKKIEELKGLIKEMDDRLDRLESSDSRVSKRVERKPSITKEVTPSRIASRSEERAESGCSRIYRLNDEGYDPLSIARQVNMSRGEVELILGLRKAKGRVNQFDI